MVNQLEPYETHPGNAFRYELERCIQPVEHSTFHSKTLFALGSSVTAGFASRGKALGEFLAYRLGMHLVKDAVSGTTLAGQGIDTYVARLKKHSKVTDTPDYFLLQLSTNDAVQGLPLDEVSAAIIEILDYVDEQWGIPIFVYTNAYFENSNYAHMVEMLYDMYHTRGGFTIIDLYNDAALLDVTDRERKLYMVDDIHPTRAGYFLWWGPAVERIFVENALKMR